MIEEKLKAAANILRQLGLDIPAGAVEEGAAEIFRVREVAEGLRRRSADCSKMADDPDRWERLIGKSSAYGHAAELIETAMKGPE